MFSSRTPRLFAAALMDLAEAMLRPVDVDEASPLHPDGAPATHAGPARAWLFDDEPFADLPVRRQLGEPQVHPRRRLREPRTRRPGAIAPAPAVCSTPLAEPSRTPRPPASIAPRHS
jgi:hypothetical protein